MLAMRHAKDLGGVAGRGKLTGSLLIFVRSTTGCQALLATECLGHGDVGYALTQDVFMFTCNPLILVLKHGRLRTLRPVIGRA